MDRIRFSGPAAGALAIAALASTGAALAQAPTQSAASQNSTEVVATPSPDADRLANVVRVLAANPRDLQALISAGDLSTRLGDTAAATAFFTRAEAVERDHPRIAAGKARLLVRMERPGEALRLFQQAEQRGLPPAEYAADRGLAYDLLGAPQLAQRDYRLALAQTREDETIRRYALSLGIAGKTEEAMAELDPLLRRSDRAAWRARAFVMAMGGDVPGAERIAATTMPGNMGLALTPFFRRLATMGPSDRAFAVHFGELRPTQTRLADAQLAPPLPAVAPEPRPVQVAAVQPAPAPSRETRQGNARDGRSNSRDGRTRRELERDREAAVTSRRARRSEAEEAAPAPTPRPSRRERVEVAQNARQVPAARREIVQPIAAPAPVTMSAPAPAGVVQRQAEQPQPATVQPISPQPQPAAVVQRQPEPAPTVIETSASLPVGMRPAPQPLPGPAQPASTVAPTPTSVPTDTRIAETPVPPAPAPAPAETQVAAVSTPAPQPGFSTSPIEDAQGAMPAPTTRIGQEDSVLSAIINNLTIPASELGVAAMPGEAPALEPRPEPVRVAAASPPPAAAPKPAAEKPAGEKLRVEKPAAKPGAKPSAADAAKGKKKPEPAKPDPKKTEPSRVWVQVAGGANVQTLPGAWRKVVAQAPAAFRGKSAWTTPLRATNRVLAGPFKTSAEAQAWVNQLAKENVSAFVFTSEAGQKVTRLAAK